MYVHMKDMVSYFPCLSGFQQGKNLSPMLFALCLCDLAYLKTRYNGLPTLRDALSAAKDQLNTNLYENLLTLLYADETVLFAETRQDLQADLKGLKLYSKH